MIENELPHIRKLEYRSPRLATALQIDFAVGDEVLHGSSRDTSESGIRARLNLPAAIGSCGMLTLHYRDGAITRRARVAHLDGLTVGLSFLPDEPDGDA